MVENPVIEVRGVSVRYGDVRALEDVNLTVSVHDFLGIIGPNGGGKSTLLKVILGLVTPDTGTVHVLGERPEQSRHAVGYVAQRPSFDREFPASVWDVVLMGRYPSAGLFHRYGEDDWAAAEQALARVEMSGARNKQIGRLSGGEQQRVFIARALVGKPKLLLLDEPLAGVDPAMQSGVYELLGELRREITVVMVSHDIGAISVHVDTLACINRRLYYHGSRELTPEILEATYQCPVQLIAHGPVPHRILKEH
ncbi:MAG: metal ABC transporter ATP-binding protein [Dehalococcoidia bacterium]|nr:metal ABC transporter ATP-binding protein [Dehalococcoidia bacterium]